MKTYQITANGGTETSVEILGESSGLTYVARSAAEAALAQLREDACDYEYYDVRYAIVAVEQSDEAELPHFARAVLGERHSGDVAILDADADDPTTEAGAKAAGNYAYLCPLRRWGDVASVIARSRAHGSRLMTAASLLLAQEGIVLR